MTMVSFAIHTATQALRTNLPWVTHSIKPPVPPAGSLEFPLSIVSGSAVRHHLGGPSSPWAGPPGPYLGSVGLSEN